ncbi:hypothetical protein [Aeromicrobium sp. Sec7.5]|uniref:hypothetical protein n=1 Tax=Aeromicrobium sp. Sec7.5 TaxID=3121276 RepID=UPI002FE4F660
MVDPLPPYPPAHDAWRFPPPPVSGRWLWVAIGGGVAATIAIVALVVTLVVAGSSDLRVSIDEPQIVDAVDAGCSTMAAGVEPVSVDGLDVDRPNRIEAQTAVVRDVVASWREIDADLRASDEPFDDWLDDWDRLVEARDDYVAELRSNPSALFEEPEVDGEPISTRMDAVLTGCPVPDTLLRPDEGIARNA